MSIENIKVPDLGDSSEVEVIELLVSVGQSVEENDSLLVLESDKAAMEIPAPMAGVVKSISVNLGDQVSTGSEMLSLEVEDDRSVKSRQNLRLLKSPLQSKSPLPMNRHPQRRPSQRRLLLQVRVSNPSKCQTWAPMMRLR